ncbi:MAG: DUF5671 domain-containing protein [Candidatus Baltobacteraceae bacterium]
MDDASLTALLRQSGCSERRINETLATYYEDLLGTEIPGRTSRSENARDAFFYLLAFLTLGVWSVALIWLADQLVDRAFPSALDSVYASRAFRYDVAGQLASLIVAFPLFGFLSRSIVRETERRPEALESGVRKWLTYLALVVTAGALVGDAVWFLEQFLVGDLTTRFAVKALVLFIVAGGIFWYYLGAVRSDAQTPHRDRVFFCSALGVVAVAVVLGFTGIGSPSYQRSVALDEQRTSDLRSIQAAIRASYRDSTGKHALPRGLGAITSNTTSTVDPATKLPYEYLPSISGPAYTLCAVFETLDRTPRGPSTWQHETGRTCFALNANHEP